MSGHPSDDALRWRVHGERTLYDNPWVRLTQVNVTAPDGNRWWHHVVRLQTVALAVVLDDRDRVLMLWRHRFAVDAFGWELPGGIVAAGESGVETAVRETRGGKPWSGRTIQIMLTNRGYLGETSFREITVPNAHDAIIDPDVFDLAQRILTERGDTIGRRAANPSDYDLTGLIICPRCGRKYIGTNATGRNRTYRYYTCFSRQRYGT